jgi:hypothetical protein
MVMVDMETTLKAVVLIVRMSAADGASLSAEAPYPAQGVMP